MKLTICKILKNKKNVFNISNIESSKKRFTKNEQFYCRENLQNMICRGVGFFFIRFCKTCFRII